MNRVAIFGGLGYQMFQYALAISMDAEGIPTKISVGDFLLNRHYQGFELIKAFDVPLSLLDRVKVSLMTKLRPIFVDTNTDFIKNTITNLFLNETNVYHEKMEYYFDEEVFCQRNSFLIGTWQSAKYFETQQKLIKEVYNFNKPHDDINIQVSSEISASNAVGVHVRRGFYIEPTLTKSKMVIDSSDYYYKAFDIISQNVDNPIFYVFSDDIEWAKNNLKGRNFVFISHNKGSNSYLDMYLMSLCQHFIIANSAFSWWPAWLSPNEDKIVIIPKPWIRESECPSIYPNNWLAIDVLTDRMQMV